MDFILLRGVHCWVYKDPVILAPCSQDFGILYSIVITLFGKEGTGLYTCIMLFVHVFVYLECTIFCLLFLSLLVSWFGCVFWLRHSLDFSINHISCSIDRPPSSFLNISSEATRPIKAKCYMEPLYKIQDEMGKRKFVRMVLVIWPRWPPRPYNAKLVIWPRVPPRPYMAKTPLKSFFRNQMVDFNKPLYTASAILVLKRLFIWRTLVDLWHFYGKVKFTYVVHWGIYQVE